MDDASSDNSQSDKQATKPVMDVQPPTTPPDPLEAPTVNTDTPAASTPDPIATPEIPATTKHGKPVGAIVMAVIIAVGIAGLATYAYIKTSNTAQPANTNQTTTSTDPAATTTDVDDASKEVDDNVNSTDETKDFPDNDLTDEALGL